MNYNDKLRESAKATGNIVCMGLDPVWEAMPLEVKKKSDGNFKRANQIFFDKIFDEMNKRNIFPSAYKPNQGFYEEHDTPLEGNFEGSQALGSLMNSLNSNFSGTPVILDSKRGDIGKSSANYARSNLERWNADACTVSPYMGTDSVMPFGLEGKGVYVLNRTSNPGAKDMQDPIVEMPGGGHEPNYMLVSHLISKWAKEHEGFGAVVGATYPKELSKIAEFYVQSGVDVPLLIPGVGGQGGSASEVISRLGDAGYDIALARINSSSGVTHPWTKKKEEAPENWAEVVVDKLEELIGKSRIAA